MKNLILSIALAITILSAYAQKPKTKTKIVKPVVDKTIDQNKFTGIGVFKIGIDTNMLISYADKHVDYIKDSDDNMTYYNYVNINNEHGGTNGLVRLKKSTKGNDVSMHNDADEYYLSIYNVAGISIKNITLKFYKNKLIGFRCDDSIELYDALKQKYGEPELTTEIKKWECLYNLTGITRELEGKTYVSEWKNGPISALSILWEKYDENCKKVTNTAFSFQMNMPELDKWENGHLLDKYNPKKDLKGF